MTSWLLGPSLVNSSHLLSREMQNVTALGPQDPFKANLLSALGVTHFEDDQFYATFTNIDDGSGSISKARVMELLSLTYGFDPLPEEAALFARQMDLDTDGSVTWSEFMAGVSEIRLMLEGVAKNATEFKSAADLHDAWFKHTRMRLGPMDKFKTPMTESQRVGWHDEEVFNERFPKKSCAETRYADAYIKSGWD